MGPQDSDPLQNYLSHNNSLLGILSGHHVAKTITPRSRDPCPGSLGSWRAVASYSVSQKPWESTLGHVPHLRVSLTPFWWTLRTQGSGVHNGTSCYVGSMSESCFSTQLGQKSPRQMMSVELEEKLIKICALSGWENISGTLWNWWCELRLRSHSGEKLGSTQWNCESLHPVN